MRARDWIAREGDGFVVLLFACVALFAALPFARLLVAALASEGQLDLAASFSAASSRAALIATRNTIEACSSVPVSKKVSSPRWP